MAKFQCWFKSSGDKMQIQSKDCDEVNKHRRWFGSEYQIWAKKYENSDYGLYDVYLDGKPKPVMYGSLEEINNFLRAR